jgi:hypothetical protein
MQPEHCESETDSINDFVAAISYPIARFFDGQGLCNELRSTPYETKAF